MMPTHPTPAATSTRPALVLGDEEIEVMPGVFLSKPSRSTPKPSHPAAASANPPVEQDWADTYASALNELPSDTLVAEFKALANSRDHLVRSNKELEEFAQEESDSAERQQLLDIVQENVALLPTFKIKQTLVAAALQKRGVDLLHSLGVKLVDQGASDLATHGTEPGGSAAVSVHQEGISVHEATTEQGQEAQAEEGVFL
ncbi:hypothetical protein BCR44DRAFT_1278393 [Catenaria anguillulae PL171]|uniref:Uncharacterized protein n=1 Tax=Catenaria anguillulae PL171 TaxID=765915 RepID=A0A1Y2HDL0_9FUNG|nr:hypothetical protein BCR44DRAFT_1278393 [Catenaria anguillulae PL171]